MKSLVFLLMLIGFVFITIGVVRSNQHCPPPKVQYRYIPKTFEQQQREEPHLTSTYRDMFEKDSPWLNTANTPKDFNTGALQIDDS
jgi:hypothetical protein